MGTTGFSGCLLRTCKLHNILCASCCSSPPMLLNGSGGPGSAEAGTQPVGVPAPRSAGSTPAGSPPGQLAAVQPPPSNITAFAKSAFQRGSGGGAGPGAPPVGISHEVGSEPVLSAV